ncbi:MAG: thioredoxin fold domain-containing protein [bacterium]|nr:thioredoxin fold domain-containing protein [bacterium]
MNRIFSISMVAILLPVFLIAAPLSGAGEVETVPVVTVELVNLGESLQSGSESQFGIVYHVPAGFHMTTTFQKIEFTGYQKSDLKSIVFPEPVSEGEFAYYRGDQMAMVTLLLNDETGESDLEVIAEYQLCREGNAGMCFQPGSATASLAINVEAAADEVVTYEESGSLQDKLKAALEKGSWLAFLMVFVGGVLASFTPCVYPMIPITVSYIGSNAGGSALKGFVLSLWYVLGIAIVYSTLGLVAAATGGAFGQATQTPIFAISVAVIIGAMAMSMAGMFDLQVPSSMANKMGGAKTGFLGPLLMGMAMGLIAAPCVGPVLIVLLTWVATTGNMFLGFWLLFTFAIGLGMLFLALGAFSGLLTALPNAGGWMDHIKHFFAIVLYALALSFLKMYVPVPVLTAVFGLMLFVSVSAWGAWKPLSETATHKDGILKGVLMFLWLLGSLLFIAGIAPSIIPSSGNVQVVEAGHIEPEWIMNEQEAFAASASSGKPLVMDFWAEWCSACKELDHKTWSSDEPLALSKQFVALKMDMTERNPANDAALKKYAVVGMPTVIFFDSEGKELERFSGFKGPDDVEKIMRRVLSQTN